MSNQYGYSHLEILAMIVITAFSNFIMIFNLLFAIKVGIPHYIFIMTMIIVTSFMYHLSDSVGTGLLLEIGVWHCLDNIASIAGIMEVFNYFMQNQLQNRLQLSWIYLFLVIILQQQYYTNLVATLGPIVLSFIVMLVKLAFFENWVTAKPINKVYLKRGLPFILVGLLAFIKGLDDQHDYLRLWHGLWHLSISTGTYHILQVLEEDTCNFRQLIQYFTWKIRE